MKRLLFTVAMACLSLMAVAQNASQQEQLRAMMRQVSRTEVKSMQSKILYCSHSLSKGIIVSHLQTVVP